MHQSGPMYAFAGYGYGQTPAISPAAVSTIGLSLRPTIARALIPAHAPAEEGLPTWAYIATGAAVVGGLWFFVFRKKPAAA